MNSMTIAMARFISAGVGIRLSGVRVADARSVGSRLPDFTRFVSATAFALTTAMMLSACGGAPARSGSVSHRTPSQSSAPLPSETPVAAPVAQGAAAATGDPQTRFAAALALLDQHQQDQAETALVSLVHDFPQLSGPSTELGLLYLRSNRRPQATQSFEQALRANSQNTVALNCLGILYRQAGDFARSEQSYLRAIALKPSDAKTHLNLGILYELSLRRPKDALDQYRESQKYAAQENLMVTAWIKELESQPNPVAMTPPSGAVTAAR